MLLVVKRWLPGRKIVVVADNSVAALDLLDAVRHAVTVVTPLRLDAAVYERAPICQEGQMGRPRKKGQRLPTLEKLLKTPKPCGTRSRSSTGMDEASAFSRSVWIRLSGIMRGCEPCRCDGCWFKIQRGSSRHNRSSQRAPGHGDTKPIGILHRASCEADRRYQPGDEDASPPSHKEGARATK